MPKVTKAAKVSRTSVAATTVSVAARLKPFGLSATKVPLTNDLEVPANQTVVLDANDQKIAGQVTLLAPTSIDDLKAWIGVPDSAFVAQVPVAAPRATVLPVHDAYTPAQTVTLHNVAREYIFGNSASVSPAQVPALNAWLRSIAGSIKIVLFQDIHIAANARLIVNPSLVVLFARYITIDQGGVLQIKCTHGGINCAGIKGAERSIIPVPIHKIPVVR